MQSLTGSVATPMTGNATLEEEDQKAEGWTQAVHYLGLGLDKECQVQKGMGTLQDV